MSIIKYISSLLPSIERSRVEEDIRILTDDISQNTLPPYEAAAEFNTGKFASSEVNKFNATFGKTIKNVDREIDGNFLQVTFGALTRTLETVNQIEDRLDKYFGKDIIASGMTYQRANILTYLESITFATKYARRLLLWTYHNEQAASGVKLDDPFTKAEVKWLFSKRDDFLNVMKVMVKKPKDIEGAIKLIPDMVIIPEEVETIKKTVGGNKLDPLNMKFMICNPIYHIRMAWTEYQVERYEAGKEERCALEYRLLVLKEAKSGKRDAGLERQIEHSENRLSKLNHKLSKMEEGV